MLVLPADHVIEDVPAFRAAALRAATAAEAGRAGHLRHRADRPETGYGYIRRGSPLERPAGCFSVARFVEKPDRATAEKFVAEGDYYWNSGMFLFRAARYLEELERVLPGNGRRLRGCGARRLSRPGFLPPG